MKKKIILTGLFMAASMAVLASCGGSNVASSNNQGSSEAASSSKIIESSKNNESTSSSSVIVPSSSSNTIPSSSSTSSKDDAKEKYVSFKVMDSDGTWKDLVNPILISGGKIDTIPDAPKKDYYTFRGWYLDANFEEQFVNENLKSSINVYAYYVADEVKVVFDGKDMGVRNLADVLNDTWNVADGLTFDGWYTNSECTVKFKAGDPAKTLYAQSVAMVTFNNGYEDVYVVKVKPKSILENPKTSNVTIDNEEKSFEEAYIVKEYMSSEDIYYVDENGNEIDFTKAITKNTTIKVLWKSPFLGYTKSPNSDDLFVSGSNYGNSDYSASDKDKVSVNSVPVISIPSKITVTDKDGNKVKYNVVAAYMQETKTFNSTALKKIIVQEGIGYIRGFSSASGASTIESIELPSTLKIIQNCFNNITGLTQNTVVIPSGVEAIYDSFWNKCNSDYNGTTPYSGVAYGFDINIPDSVRSLSMVPMNFKFSNNSSFTNDGEMIYQTTTKGKVLVSYYNIVNGVINVPEGVNGIQVGAFVEMSDLKTLVLPKSFSFINYNLELNDYKYCYVWNQSDYSNYECWLHNNELTENDYSYQGRMIVTTLTGIDYVVFNSDISDSSIYTAFGGDTTGWAKIGGTFTYADNEIYNGIKVVNTAKTTTPLINVSFKNIFTNDKYRISISRTSTDPITILDILEAIDSENGTNYLQLYNNNHLDITSITQFGTSYDLTATNECNKYLDINVNLINYSGITYQEEDGEIIVTGLDEETAIDFSDNTYGVIIPDEIDGKKVTKIANDAFKENFIVKIVKLGKNIKEIGDSAFESAGLLESIDFNDAKIEVIGKNAFMDTALTSFSFSLENLKSVGSYAFKINTLKKFIPVGDEGSRNASNIKDGEFYFETEQVINDAQTAYEIGYVSLNQRVSATVDGDKTIYDVNLYAYAVKNTSDGNSIKLGNIENPNSIVRVSVLEGAISYITSSNKIYLYSVLKINKNAFTSCQIGSRKLYYSITGLGITTSISTIGDLVDALPLVFAEGFIDNYDSVSSVKVRTC